jgi:hypothetical protein
MSIELAALAGPDYPERLSVWSRLPKRHACA